MKRKKMKMKEWEGLVSRELKKQILKERFI